MLQIIKKAALLLPPVKRKQLEFRALHAEIDTLRTEIDVLRLKTEALRSDNDFLQKAVTRSKLSQATKFPEAGFSAPPVWFGRFSNKDEYDNDTDFHVFSSLASEIDEEVVRSHRPYQIKAYCPLCKHVTAMQLTFNTGHIDNKGVNNAWSEDVICMECGCCSRHRALIDFLEGFVLPRLPLEKIYISEATTSIYAYLKTNYPDVTGSEFFGDGIAGGTLCDFDGSRICHEDITELSFGDESFDVVISQHVFEHIPDYLKGFKECCRVLKKGGYLIFSVPFFIGEKDTRVIARVGEGGEICEVNHPPEYHGNPVDSSSGSRCFQHFGWDMLDCVRQAGFSDVSASFYWGRWKGFIGGRANNMVFSGRK